MDLAQLNLGFPPDALRPMPFTHTMAGNIVLVLMLFLSTIHTVIAPLPSQKPLAPRWGTIADGYSFTWQT